jgi:hypothetical protein
MVPLPLRPIPATVIRCADRIDGVAATLGDTSIVSSSDYSKFSDIGYSKAPAADPLSLSPEVSSPLPMA